MIPDLPSWSRLLLWVAGRLVPASQRNDWTREWQGELWHWMAEQSATGRYAEARPAMLSHATGAFQDAFYLRLQQWEPLREKLVYAGSPQFCLSCCILVLAVIAATSGFFERTRQLAGTLPYRDPDRLAILTQRGLFMGQRLGILAKDSDRMRRRTDVYETMASYRWYSTSVSISGSHYPVQAAMVSPEFLELLGIGPEIGRRQVWVSSEFWKGSLGRPASGAPIRVGQEVLTLGGVLPAGFSFLSAKPQIWTVTGPPPADYIEALLGHVVRLRPGIPEEQASQQFLTSLPRKPLQGRWIELTPIGGITNRAFRTYGIAFLLGLLIVAVLTAAGLLQARELRISRAKVVEFWAFFAIRTSLLLLAVVLVVFEYTRAGSLGMLGETEWGNELPSAWVFLFGSGMVLRWSWLDQHKRCPACLWRLGMPVRIGIPGLMLLDHSGQELICRMGHGSLYAPESVLRAEGSDHWIGLLLQEPHT